MSIPVIQPGSWMIYRGPGAGRGFRHKVLEIENGWVVTWSESTPRFDGGGHSWYGPLADFLKHFVGPIKPKDT